MRVISGKAIGHNIGKVVVAAAAAESERRPESENRSNLQSL